MTEETNRMKTIDTELNSIQMTEEELADFKKWLEPLKDVHISIIGPLRRIEHDLCESYIRFLPGNYTLSSSPLHVGQTAYYMLIKHKTSGSMVCINDLVTEETNPLVPQPIPLAPPAIEPQKPADPNGDFTAPVPKDEK